MKIKESIFRRNFLTMVAILVISFSVLTVSFTGLTYRVISNEKKEGITANAEEVSELLSVISSEDSISGLSVRMSMMIVSKTTGYEIMVCDSTGSVVSYSGPGDENSYLGGLVSDTYLNDIMEDGEYSGLTSLSRILHEPQFVVGKAVVSYSTDAIVGYVFVSGTLNTLDGIWRQAAIVFGVSALVVLVIAFLLCMLSTLRQVEPINQMADAANKFAKGDFSVRVSEEDRTDEIGELAKAFNVMADSMEKSETRRREFIANVSHELKTPMTTIAGFADGIMDGTIPPNRQREYLQIISSETRRLSRLVRSMLDMSQRQGSDKVAMRAFDLTEVVCQAILSLEKKIVDRGLDVDAVLPEENVNAMGDPDSITQVVYNLIDNATKFADKGSAIRIELWKQNTKAYVSVENHGETISKEELPRIFERFHKTDRSRSMDRDGVGLGLYIVKTIMDSHNGDIYVTSEDGVTKFVISLDIPENL